MPIDLKAKLPGCRFVTVGEALAIIKASAMDAEALAIIKASAMDARTYDLTYWNDAAARWIARIEDQDQGYADADKAEREKPVTVAGVLLEVGRWYDLTVKSNWSRQPRGLRVLRYTGRATANWGRTLDGFGFQYFGAPALKGEYTRERGEAWAESEIVSVRPIEPTPELLRRVERSQAIRTGQL